MFWPRRVLEMANKKTWPALIFQTAKLRSLKCLLTIGVSTYKNISPALHFYLPIFNYPLLISVKLRTEMICSANSLSSLTSTDAWNFSTGDKKSEASMSCMMHLIRVPVATCPSCLHAISMSCGKTWGNPGAVEDNNRRQ